MKKTTLKSAVFAFLSSVALASSPVTAAEEEFDCPEGTSTLEVSGKIENNLQLPDFSRGPSSIGTLGVAAIKLGTGQKLKCALAGEPIFPDPDDNDLTISYIHTISCDDAVQIAPGVIQHSQLTFDTEGLITPTGQCGFDGTFTETSTPRTAFYPYGGPVSSGRGLFSGVTSGEIKVEGAIQCSLIVDMTFKGKLCLPGTQ